MPELRSVGLLESKESHGFSVDKKNVFEIEGEAAGFLFKNAPKHVDISSCNPAAYEQHHGTFSANNSIDSAAHFGLSVQSFHSFRCAKGPTEATSYRLAIQDIAKALPFCKRLRIRRKKRRESVPIP